ncbi:MAG: hypothetical protein J1F32_01700 [Erysipelotrichales bacterium]|nr:hypothetical protein [Erysipelotrichales bacterium]
MKKTKILLSIIALMGLSSCDLSTYDIPKPNDTNLEFWITEKVTSDKLESLSIVPGVIGNDVYLGSDYSLNDDGILHSMPTFYVAYRLTDVQDEEFKIVTYIEITDPAVTFYGISINSTSEEIENAMTKQKFKVSYNSQGYINASKKSANFAFYNNSIRITTTSL